MLFRSFVTLNPAKQLRIDQYVGSIEPGKHADLTLWSGHPLDTMSRCEQTWVDGIKYFDRAEQAELTAKQAEMKRQLAQKVLDSKQSQQGQGEEKVDPATLWPRHDEFCHGHQHDDEEDRGELEFWQLLQSQSDHSGHNHELNSLGGGR